MRAPGLIAVVYGILLLIGVASGGTDPLQPLASLRGAGVGGGQAATAESDLVFETIKSVDDLQARVAAATASGKTVMLDVSIQRLARLDTLKRLLRGQVDVVAALQNIVIAAGRRLSPWIAPLLELLPDRRQIAREVRHSFALFGKRKVPLTLIYSEGDVGLTTSISTSGRVVPGFPAIRTCAC